MIYLIGSLRNPKVTALAQLLRSHGHEVFDDWMAAGPEADDKWREYEIERGRTYVEALRGNAARHVFEYDRQWLNRCDTGVLLCPAGKSGHLELGYLLGQGKRGFILLDSPDRWDVMYQFATKVCSSPKELLEALRV